MLASALNRCAGLCGRFLLTTIGFTCLYTVAVVFFYCDWIFDLSVPVDTFAYAILLNGFLCLGALFTFFVARRLRSEFLLIVAGFAGYLIAAVCLAAASIEGSALWAYVAGASAGWGVGTLMPLWFDRAGVLAGQKFALALGLASLASGLAALLVGALPILANAAACAALVAVSVGLLVALSPSKGFDQSLPTKDGCAVSDTPSGKAKECGPLKSKPWRPLVMPLLYVVILSIVYGVLDTVASAAITLPSSWSGLASQLGGLATIVVFLVYVRLDGKRYVALLNVALAVIATGLLFLPFLGDMYRLALVVLTHMGWEMALLVSYALVIETLRGDRRLLVGWAALVFAFPRPGVMAGAGLAVAVAGEGSYAFTQIVIVAIALLYLIMTGVWLLRTGERRAAERTIRRRDELIKRYAQARDDLHALACEEVAGRFELTKREAELLRLLSQGRDAAFIEKELFLSRNTIKSYMKTLYSKLDVHSKQELIDLVKDGLPLE